MKINKARTHLVRKWVSVFVIHKRKKIEFFVQMVDGVVMGNAKSGFATSYLKYFDENSQRIKDKHFKQIKSYVEKHIK